MTPILEHVSGSDLPALVALERAGQAHPWSEASLRQACEDERTWVLGAFAAHDRQVLLGFASFYRLPFDTELQAITVLPEVRRQGVAGRLLRAGIEQARCWDSERLLLEVRASNRAAIGLYEQAGCGHDGVRRGYYAKAQGAREDALLMSLTLGAGKA
ncbi:MAG: GNAT family N-acetyltransferase [Halomonas sp.]|nr:GNAT family N-acetyltransferase [Halomonas sp.]